MVRKMLGRQLRLWALGGAAALCATLFLPFILEGAGAAVIHNSDSPQVLAIVQGKSAQAAAAAVRDVGALVIEKLDGVQAVGARLTNSQRSELSTHNDITRIWISD